MPTSVRRFVSRSRAPLTIFLLILLGFFFLLRLFFPQILEDLVFLFPHGRPWGFLSYMLAGSGPLEAILGGLWLYLAGTSMERRWGGGWYGLLWLGVVLGPSLGLAGASLVTGQGIMLNGLALPLAGLTVAWCLTFPEGTVLFGFILPVSTRIFLWLDLLLAFSYIAILFGPLAGVFALAGPGLAYLCVMWGPERKWHAAVRYSRRRYSAPAARRRRRLRSVK